jgi:1,4-alpha-glucan branching enzyme
LLGPQDLYLFNEGTHFRLYNKLGAHPLVHAGIAGTYFAVWAPAAERVSIIGAWNGWDPARHPLRTRGSSGIWEGFVPGAVAGMNYKYHIRSRYHGYRVDKADPFAFCQQTPPETASTIWNLDYRWGDEGWMSARRSRQSLQAPIMVYELHLGSWMRVPDEGHRPLGYREIAPRLAEHIKKLGFTHVELLPVMEHPFYGSWGYQVTGFFAPTRRYGNPQDLMYLIDTLHQHDIGVFLDWVPAHFPTDEHGLIYFDGTHLYEHADPQQRIHPDWKSAIFNYGRHEVRSFLISNALFWLDRYHADGLRIDAVASMLYLDYSRRPGEWVPNRYGGRENLEAMAFLRRLNDEVYRHYPDVQTVAEESTSWPMVSRPTYVGGLGFGFKWDMGWMHDTLQYFHRDPIHRHHHHNELTFRMLYAFTENFILPLSHDEVVHGKGSLLAKMPGDDWQKFANLRLLYGYMVGQPGKKLLFMGAELAPWQEWHHEHSLDWHLLQYPRHSGIMRWLSDLACLYRAEPGLHELDCEPGGFEWIDCSDASSSILAFLRKSSRPRDSIVVAMNATPVPRADYRLGVPISGRWHELLNSDASFYGGSGMGNQGGVMAQAMPFHGKPYSINLLLPPLGILFFKCEDQSG